MAEHGPCIRFFLCGDVMIGRGIDQIRPPSCDPALHEPWVGDARHYRTLAEEANGPIPTPVDAAYPWGDALGWLEAFRPDVRLINLETALTCSEDWWRGKGVHYRAHPDNAGILESAGIGCCALANNHVLDWGHQGLRDTLAALPQVAIDPVGAGTNLSGARGPAVLAPPSGGRVVVVALGSESSGIPQEWAAQPDRPGVWLVDESHPEEVVAAVEETVNGFRGEANVVVASIHWGANWGYAIPEVQRRLAHALIDRAGVDLVHGHSSHHPKGVEVYRDRLILYGCGDFLNDYEGIPGGEAYRPELTLMYFPELDRDTGRLRALTLRPMRIRRFQVVNASPAEGEWLRQRLNRESEDRGAAFSLDAQGSLHLVPS